jgi:uncharacterized tellurite resistance protein B-like protein
MLDRLLRLLEGREAPVAAPSGDDLRLAVAALLVEAARMDQSFGEEERAAVAALLSRRFELSGPALSTLLERADVRVRDTVQYFPFTHNINQMMSAAEKAEVIEMLWRVAYADGTLDPHEDQLIRQIAGLIHVPDRERMLARKRALEGW